MESSTLLPSLENDGQGSGITAVGTGLRPPTDAGPQRKKAASPQPEVAAKPGQPQRWPCLVDMPDTTACTAASAALGLRAAESSGTRESNSPGLPVQLWGQDATKALKCGQAGWGWLGQASGHSWHLTHASVRCMCHHAKLSGSQEAQSRLRTLETALPAVRVQGTEHIARSPRGRELRPGEHARKAKILHLLNFIFKNIYLPTLCFIKMYFVTF